MSATIPSHLPRRLTISLWDFSWYTMTQPGEPFADLDEAFAQAEARGYNTVRICAMPRILFTDSGPRSGPLRFASLGGDFGQRTRWYNCKGGAVLDGHRHLLHLFRAAKRHNCFIILSSWEYQQSPSFLAAPDLFQELVQVPPAERFLALARSMGQLVTFVKEHGLADRIAYVELHNEVDVSRLREVAQPDQDPIAAQKPYLEEAITVLRAQHPDVLITTSYARPRLYRLQDVAQNAQVAHSHLYVYGVLGALFEAVGLRAPTEPFPTATARALLRPDAPSFEEWKPPAGEEWRLEATLVNRRLFYIHDWVDPVKWDLWLYEHYPAYREAMRQEIRLRLEAISSSIPNFLIVPKMASTWP